MNTLGLEIDHDPVCESALQRGRDLELDSRMPPPKWEPIVRSHSLGGFLIFTSSTWPGDWHAGPPEALPNR